MLLNNCALKASKAGAVSVRAAARDRYRRLVVGPELRRERGLRAVDFVLCVGRASEHGMTTVRIRWSLRPRHTVRPPVGGTGRGRAAADRGGGRSISPMTLPPGSDLGRDEFGARRRR